MSQADGFVQVHPENCIGCELCYDVCPFDSVQLRQTAPGQLAEGYFDIPDGVYETGKFESQRNNPASIGKEALKKSA